MKLYSMKIPAIFDSKKWRRRRIIRQKVCREMEISVGLMHDCHFDIMYIVNHLIIFSLRMSLFRRERATEEDTLSAVWSERIRNCVSFRSINLPLRKERLMLRRIPRIRAKHAIGLEPVSRPCWMSSARLQARHRQFGFNTGSSPCQRVAPTRRHPGRA